MIQLFKRLIVATASSLFLTEIDTWCLQNFFSLQSAMDRPSSFIIKII